jgi:predicted aspartyl protease
MLRLAPRRRIPRLTLLVQALLLIPALSCGKEAKPSAAVLTLPLKTFGGRPVVAVTINDRGPYEFILDSGAAVTMIDAKLATELGLTVSGTMEAGSPLGPPATFEVTQLDRVGVGPLALAEQKALLFDFAQLFGAQDAPRGVLSYLAIDGYLIVHDYPGGEIRLERGELRDGTPNVFPLGGDDRLAEISATIAGHVMRLHVDTGSPGPITLPLSVAESLPLVAAPVVRGTGNTVNGSFKIYSATLDGVAEIGSFRLVRPELNFIEGASIGNIGNGFLSGYVVTIDPAGRKLRLEEASRGAKPTRVLLDGGSPKRYGIRFAGIAGERLNVTGVDPGSPAAKAGIKEGDVIVGMNGRLVSELDQSARVGALRNSPLRLDVLTGDRYWVCTLTLE